jgi:Ca2+-binding RTX toxin-like protein
MNRIVFDAILAMDSYNRGYDQGVFLGELDAGGDPIVDSDIENVSIGNATIILDSRELLDENGQSLDQPRGFYALAYELPNGETVVSYRGTNEALDTVTGYGVGLGVPTEDQAILAFGFYNAVAQSSDPFETITVTGHSLGGGLAGLIGAVIGLDGRLYDNMAFELAALNTPLVAQADDVAELFGLGNGSFKQLVYGNGDIYDPIIVDDNPNGPLITYSLDGEFLGYLNRGLQQTHEHEYVLPGNPDLDPSGFEFLELHSIAALAVHAYAETELAGQTDWHIASPYFWPVLFNDAFAQSIGESDAATLLSKIAYSAIDEGTRVFGDTAIRALYDDANDLGVAITAAQSDATNAFIQSIATDISEVFVHFTGQLALQQVEALAVPGALASDGVLTYTDHGNNQNLTLNFSDSYWSSVLNTTQHYLDYGRGKFMISALSTLGINTDDMLDTTLKAWGNGSYTVFDRVVLSTTSSGTSIIEDSSYPDPDKGALFIGGNGNDTVTGSSGNDLIYGFDGQDRIYGHDGDDIRIVGGNATEGLKGASFYGGDGNDTVDYSGVVGVSVNVDPRYVSGRSIVDNTSIGSRDYAFDVETFILTDYDDSAYIYESGLRYTIYGGDGNDTVYGLGIKVTDNLYYTFDGTSYAYVYDVENIPIPSSSILLADLTKSVTYGATDITGKDLDYSHADSGIFASFPDGYIRTGGHLDTFDSPAYNLNSLTATNHSDYIYMDWREHLKLIKPGFGDDVVYIPYDSGWDDRTSIEYSGGNDVYWIAPEVKYIYLAESISLEDISTDYFISQTENHWTIRLDIENHGSLTLFYDGVYPETNEIRLRSGGIIRYESLYSHSYSQFALNEDIFGVNHVVTHLSGTWGDDKWIGRAGYGQTYSALAGNDSLDGLDGNDTLTGGIGEDTFVFARGYDHDIVTDFVLGEDFVDLSLESEANSFESLNLQALGNHTILTLSDGSTLTLQGVRPDELNASDFILFGEDKPAPSGTIQGDNNNDMILGSAENDVMYGYGGDDHITADTGNDSVFAGEGNDSIFGNGGNDTLYGEDGNDTIDAGSGNDIIWGGNGNDRLIGSEGNDIINGGNDTDIAIYSGFYADYVMTENFDHYALRDNNVSDGDDGEDQLYSIEQINFVDGFYEFSTGVFTPTPTDDVFIGTSSAEVFDGGLGNDTVDYSTSDGYVKVNLTSGVISNGHAAGDTLISIENIIGSDFKDTLTGSSDNNIFQGGGGNDKLYGEEGDDTLHGDEGNDTLKGRNGNDTLYGGSGIDYLEGGSGNDIFYGGLGVDIIKGSSGVDTFVYLSAEEGGDTINDFNINAGETIDLTAVLINAAGFTDTTAFTGGYLRTAQNGSDAQIFLDMDGSAGSNAETLFVTLKGVTASHITLSSFVLPTSGNAPNTAPIAVDDVFSGTQDANIIGNLLVDNGNGADSDADGDALTVTAQTLTTTHGSVIISANGDFTYTPTAGYVGDDSFSYTVEDGNGDSDNGHVSLTLTATGITGTSSADTITGAADDDVIYGLGGNDRLYGEEGNDTLHGGDDNDTLKGRNGDDLLYGGDGVDYLEGGSGNDTLQGGLGADTLKGSAGVDTFVYQSMAEAGDTINDFNLGAGEAIDISDLLSGYDPLADAITDFVHITDDGTNSTVSIDSDGGADNFIHLVTLNGVTGITDEDTFLANGHLIAA